jgi:hypothetical protein
MLRNLAAEARRKIKDCPERFCDSAAKLREARYDLNVTFVVIHKPIITMQLVINQWIGRHTAQWRSWDSFSMM